jgi:hypothetical protein
MRKDFVERLIERQRRERNRPFVFLSLVCSFTLATCLLHGELPFVAELKLFVVGESSPNPDEWHSMMRSLVVAKDETQAIEISGVSGPATEIILDEPKVIFFDREYENDY